MARDAWISKMLYVNGELTRCNQMYDKACSWRPSDGLVFKNIRLRSVQPTIYLLQNTRKQSRNKNKKHIAGRFASFFCVSRPVFRFSHFAFRSILSQGQHSRKNSDGKYRYNEVSILQEQLSRKCRYFPFILKWLKTGKIENSRIIWDIFPEKFERYRKKFKRMFLKVFFRFYSDFSDNFV